MTHRFHSQCSLLVPPEAEADPGEEAELEAGAGEAAQGAEAGGEAGGDLVAESGVQELGEAEAEHGEAVSQGVGAFRKKLILQ